MEVRLPLVWKSHPVLIDPHPPPSLHSHLSPYASPLVSPTSPRTFLQLPSLLPSLYLSLSNRYPLRRSSSYPHHTLSIPQRSLFKPSPTFFPIPPPFSSLSALTDRLVSLAKKFTFAKKKGKRPEKSMRHADWPRSAGTRVCIRSRHARGRGLKMSSRCVIAYIDPTLPGVYAAPADAIPTRGIPRLRRPRDASTSARCVHRRDREHVQRSGVQHSIAAPACITCVRGCVRGGLKKNGIRHRSSHPA